MDFMKELIEHDGYLMMAFIFLCLCVLTYKLYRSFKIHKDYSSLFVLITGCDTGFGYRCAIKLDQLGFNVFAACLTKDKVTELLSQCSQKMRAFQMDVTSEDSVRDGLKLVKSNLNNDIGLWAVINNAGVFGSFGACEWFQKSDYQETINVNLLGTASVTNTFLPLIRKSQGRVVIMCSVLSRFSTIPAPYSVSKYCVGAYANCLRRELAGQGVSVHMLEPGGYRTNITDCNLHSKSMNKVFERLSPDLQEFYGEKFKNKLINLVWLFFVTLVSGNLDEVVDTYIHAVTARFPKTRYVVGFNGNFVFRPLALLPTWLSDICMTALYPRPKGCC